MSNVPAGTVMLIHGPCLKALSWEEWIPRYSTRGYCVIATGVPELPVRQSCLEVWPRDRVEFVVEYYERLLVTVATPPILVGHCFGGTIVQILLDRGLGAAGIAISAPPVPAPRTYSFGAAGQTSAAKPQRRARARPALQEAPLLLVGAGRDHHVPPEIVKSAERHRSRNRDATGYLEYPDGCHHALRAPGWEQLADDVLDWAELFTDPGCPTTPGHWRD